MREEVNVAASLAVIFWKCVIVLPIAELPQVRYPLTTTTENGGRGNYGGSLWNSTWAAS